MLHFTSMVLMIFILPLLLECVDSVEQFEKIFFIGEHLNLFLSVGYIDVYVFINK